MATNEPITITIDRNAVLVLNPHADQASVIDALSAELSQLEGMSNLLTGEELQAFRRMSETMQEDYLWALQQKIEQARRLSQMLRAQNASVAIAA